MIHTAKGFGGVNKAEVDVFLVFSCFFDDPVNAGNLISGSSGFSKSSLNIWKFIVHVLLKPGVEKCGFTMCLKISVSFQLCFSFPGFFGQGPLHAYMNLGSRLSGSTKKNGLDLDWYSTDSTGQFLENKHLNNIKFSYS